jgi:predicted dehydrogenase
VNAARLIAGEPVRVSGEQVLGGDGVDVAFAGTMAFAGADGGVASAGGVLAHFDAGLELAPRAELEVVGNAGSLFLSDPWRCVEPMIELRRPGRGARMEVERIEVERVNPFRLEAENMSAAIRGEAPLLLDREDAVGQARAIEALYAAAAAHD